MGEAFALLLGGGSSGPIPEFFKKECNLVQSDQCILRLDYFSQVGLLTFILPRQGRIQEFLKGSTHHVTHPKFGVKYAFSWQLGTK